MLGTTETLPDSSPRTSVASVYELYQPMHRKDGLCLVCVCVCVELILSSPATFPRPVVVVGVLDNEVIQNLATDPDFTICPEGKCGDNCGPNILPALQKPLGQLLCCTIVAV